MSGEGGKCWVYERDTSVEGWHLFGDKVRMTPEDRWDIFDLARRRNRRLVNDFAEVLRRDHTHGFEE